MGPKASTTFQPWGASTITERNARVRDGLAWGDGLI